MVSGKLQFNKNIPQGFLIMLKCVWFGFLKAVQEFINSPAQKRHAGSLEELLTFLFLSFDTNKNLVESLNVSCWLLTDEYLLVFYAFNYYNK